MNISHIAHTHELTFAVYFCSNFWRKQCNRLIGIEQSRTDKNDEFTVQKWNVQSLCNDFILALSFVPRFSYLEFSLRFVSSLYLRLNVFYFLPKLHSCSISFWTEFFSLTISRSFYILCPETQPFTRVVKSKQNSLFFCSIIF